MANISQLKKVWSFKTVFDHLFWFIIIPVSSSQKPTFTLTKNATWGFPQKRCLSNPTGSVWYDHLRDHDLTYRFVRAFGLRKLLNLNIWCLILGISTWMVSLLSFFIWLQDKPADKPFVYFDKDIIYSYYWFPHLSIATWQHYILYLFAYMFLVILA